MIFRTFVVSTLIVSSSPAARAESVSNPDGATSPAVASNRLAFEVNALSPFFPGGISELKLLVPVLRTTEDDWRGEILLGSYSDFATRFVRADDRYGKVSILAAKIGYRQFMAYGLHVEASINSGWRHEDHNVWDGGTLDAFTMRLWLMSGVQRSFGERFYANVRGGLGVHLLRTDRFADKERKLVPGGDLNVGFRF